MKHLILIHTLLITLFTAPLINCYAQNAAKVKSTIEEIVKKHEAKEGISCMTVAKGSGLEMVKMMFNKEFGKDFMKGVTAITIIDYSDASEETCLALRKDLDSFTSLLQEFDVSNEEKFSDNSYIRCFASASEHETLSDFLIAAEDAKTKMLMHMSGKIKVK
jgi:hypothetical protein